MINVRRANERGHANHGWLDSHHTFSFADYHDPAHMGFRALRVINEDRVAPGRGFGTHGHRDMEIVSYVLGGALDHKDSMGNGSTIRPGDVQRLSAGTGITHSEFNGSQTEPVHFLQIWLLPNEPGRAPSYEQKSFSTEEKRGRLRVVGSPSGDQGAVAIASSATMFAGLFGAKERAEHLLAADRYAWVHVVNGRANVNGHELGAGDAASFAKEPSVVVEGVENAEVLVFDLA